MEGTKNESLVKWSGSHPGVALEVDICQPGCSLISKDGLLHCRVVQKVLDSTRAAWMSNLVAAETPMGAEDELRRLRLREKELAKRKRTEDDKGVGEPQEDTLSGSSEDAKKKRKKKKKKDKVRVVGTKSPAALFATTALDPKPEVRRRVRRRARRLTKRRNKKESTGSSGSSSVTSDTGSSEADGARLFGEEVRVKKVWRKSPGALTLNTLEQMQPAVVTTSGQMWDLDRSSLPPIFSQYWKLALQSKMSGPLGRESQTLCFLQDLLLQGAQRSGTDLSWRTLQHRPEAGVGAAGLPSDDNSNRSTGGQQDSARGVEGKEPFKPPLGKETRVGEVIRGAKGKRQDKGQRQVKGKRRSSSSRRSQQRGSREEVEASPECGPWVRGHGSVWKPPMGLMGRNGGESAGSGMREGELVGSGGDGWELEDSGEAQQWSAAMRGDSTASPVVGEDNGPSRFPDTGGDPIFHTPPHAPTGAEGVGHFRVSPEGKSFAEMAGHFHQMFSFFRAGSDFVHSRVQCSGEVFPLPENLTVLSSQVGHLSADGVVVLQALCSALNSYYGVAGAKQGPLTVACQSALQAMGRYADDWSRLIMNMVPVNKLCRNLGGDISTLPSWAGMTPYLLEDEQVLVMSSEDIRCFFYLFEVPVSWRPFMAFNKPVPQHVVGDGVYEPHYLASRVLPMGFLNSVSVAQHVHRRIARMSLHGLQPSLGPQCELRKDRPFTVTQWVYRIYLDNFDALEQMDPLMAARVRGEVSAEVLALRGGYQHWGLPRHPKKAVQQETIAEIQGAVVDGVTGMVKPKPNKVLKYAELAWSLLQDGRASQKQLQIVCGGLVYCSMFRRPLLGMLNKVWSFVVGLSSEPPVVRKELPQSVKFELCRFLCALPLAQMNLRTPVLGGVTASDASETGGGFCVSRGLTPMGVHAAQCSVRGDMPELEDFVQVLTVGLFDGVGALRVAADVLQLPMGGHISAEVSVEGSRVLESNFPDTIAVGDVAGISENMVLGWALKILNAGVVLVGGGPPC